MGGDSVWGQWREHKRWKSMAVEIGSGSRPALTARCSTDFKPQLQHACGKDTSTHSSTGTSQTPSACPARSRQLSTDTQAGGRQCSPHGSPRGPRAASCQTHRCTPAHGSVGWACGNGMGVSAAASEEELLRREAGRGGGSVTHAGAQEPLHRQRGERQWRYRRFLTTPPSASTMAPPSR